VPPASNDQLLRFGHFEISPAERVLRVDGAEVALGARAFDVLLALAQRRGRLISKQELLDLVWPGVVVEEHNIATQISTLRKLLGANVIATVPGRGYRFTALPTENADRIVDAVGTPATSASTADAPPVVHTHLPHRLTPLVGREDDLTKLAALMQRHRLVTVVGAGGMGKTLLAQHLLASVGGDYAHGICWVELASLSDAAILPARIAETLGVRAAPGDPLAGLCAAVAPLSMLVALDNAEHLLADVARAVAALLDAAQGLRLLVTSQAPLRLAAEHVYRLGPLALPQGPLPATLAQSFGAVALLVERARGADARFVLTDANAPAAIELCRQLDGLPLAIELAAARAPLLGIQQLAATLQDRLHLLTRNRDATAPARQQTLRAALEWSYSFLDERERIVFRRMGVMAGSASLGFIQQVVADEQGALDAWAVLDALGVLLDRSFVAVLEDETDQAGEPRYRVLESPRMLAIEQLRAAGEEATLRRRHATALAAAFDAAWDERYSGRIGAQQWADRVLQDASNARNAIAWARVAGEPDCAVAIAATLCRSLPWSSHGERMALADLCESVADQVASPRLRLRALGVPVDLKYLARGQQALELAGKAVALARELDRAAPDRWTLYHALTIWIRVAALASHPVLDALRAALAEIATLEDPRWPVQRLTRGVAAMQIAAVSLDSRDLALHLLLTRRMVAGLEAEGSDTASAMGSLIDVELQCGHTQEAVRLGERMLERVAGTRDKVGYTCVGGNLASALLALGNTERARALLQTVWPSALQTNLHVLCSDYLGLLAALEGRPRTAARLAGYADAVYAVRDILRQPGEAAARERNGALARDALDDAPFERLLAEGRELRDEQIAPLAFANEDSL